MSWKVKLLAVFLFASAWSVYHEHYVGKWQHTINIDGIGYNAYLPALFIHDGNLSWDCYENVFKKLPVFQNRLQDFRKPADHGTYVNKYPPGLAVTQAPFWFSAWAYFGFSDQVSGFETPFQVAVHVNNLFWLFLGMWLFSLFLISKGWSPNRVVALQIILIFSTNLFHFITFDNSLTHPVTLGLSMAGFYFLDRYITAKHIRNFIAFLFIVMLLFWLRPVNVLMVPLYLFYYFFSNETVRSISRQELTYAGLFLVLTLLFYFGDIKLQTGNWLVYSYQNEKFVFNEFHLPDVLWGYRCGLFLYVPVLLIFIFLWFRNPNRKLVISYSAGLLFTAYIVSCWNEYCYGCRLGNRPMIDYFAFFIVPAIHADFNFKKAWKIAGISCIVFCIYYNQILHYQYRHYLLDWCDVKKEQFWNVFLRTHKPG